MKKLSEIIKEERKLRKLTQDDLANRLKISKSTVAMWETDKRLPSKELYEQIADLFNVDIDYLYGRTTTRKKYHFDDYGNEYVDANMVHKDCVYYLNDETRKIAQEIFEDNDMKLLFDMRKTTQFDALMKYARYLKEQYDKENNL